MSSTPSAPAKTARRDPRNKVQIKPKPRYSEVADQLRLQILTGRYAVGDLLPSEAELKLEFNVGRHTVREAIRQLQLDGMALPEHGRGVRVQSDRPGSRVNVVFGSLEGIARYGRVTHLVDVESTMVRADEALARRMHCAVGDELLRMRSRRVPRDSNSPWTTAWNETHFLGRFAAVADKVERWSGAVYALVEKLFDEKVVSIHQEARAINLDKHLAERLGCRVGVAGLEVRRTYFNAQGVALLMGNNTYVGSEFTLEMDIKN